MTHLTRSTRRANPRNTREGTKIIRLFIRCLVGFFLFSLAACVSRSERVPNTETPTPSATSPFAPTATATLTPTPDSGSFEGPVTLRVWIPPEFDTQANTAASDLLLARLHAFNTLYPGVRVEVRIKSASGTGGLLESLSATEAVSPEALPDLVALSRSTMESAAIKGLLVPYNDLIDVQADADWYEFAAGLGRLENKTFGLPFAGDALVLAYRPEMVGPPPTDWTTTLAENTTLLFPAGSRQALFTLALYQAAGGRIRDEQGRPIINPPTLTAVFQFYRDAIESGVLSANPDNAGGVLKYLNGDDTWDALLQGDAHMSVTWVSNPYQAQNPGIAATLIPTPGGVPFALTDGWVWAIANPDPRRQALSAALAQYLTASDFLAQWTHAAGYLPPRPSALADWPETSERALASRIILAAKLIPPLDVLNTLGPVLQQTTAEVLTGQVDPETAAQNVATRLGVP